MNRKINKLKAPIEPIKINLIDNGKFADLAFFFDQIEVMQEIGQLRKGWVYGKTINNKDIVKFLNEDRDSKGTRHFWNNYAKVNKIAKRFNVGSNFLPAITAAVLSSEVTEGDYSKVSTESVVYGLPEELRLNEKAVFLSGSLRDSDLNFLKRSSYSKGVATVKRNREWYWLHQKGFGYKKLEKLTGDNIDTIRSGLESYQKKLDSWGGK